MATASAQPNEVEVHQWNNITLGGRVSSSLGVLKINSHGIGWKSKAGATETIDKDLLSNASWIRTGKASYQLELRLKNGSTMKFDGFREQDQPNLQSDFKQLFAIELQPLEVATKGWNWGDIEIQGSILTFMVDRKRAFDLPLTDVSRGVLHGAVGTKNDVSLEFNPDDALPDDAEAVTEIRFHFPTGEDDKNQAQAFLNKVLSKADVGATTGKSLVEFDKMPILTPRGRYTIEMFPTFMKLHGKTYDYKVNYSNISRLFQLPKPDQRYVYFVISVDPPIRQGQTRYPHLVLLFPKDEKIEAPVNIPKESLEKYKELLPNKQSKDEEDDDEDDEEKKKKEEGTATEEDKAKDASKKKEKDKDAGSGKLKGRTFELVSKAFKVLSGKKITIPNNYKSSGGATAIKCSLKANDGFLYPLERSFFFVHKPPTHIRFDDITLVEFSRVSDVSSTTNKTFDLLVTTKNNGLFQFTGIQRQEYQTVLNFINSKKIPSKITMTEVGETLAAAAKEIAADDDSEEDDEDFVGLEEEQVPEEFESEDSDDDEDMDEEPEDDDDMDEEPPLEPAEPVPAKRTKKPVAPGSAEKKDKKTTEKPSKKRKSSEKKDKKEKKERSSSDKKEKKSKKEKKHKKEKKDKKPKREKSKEKTAE